MLSTEYFLANIDVGTAANERSKVLSGIRLLRNHGQKHVIRSEDLSPLEKSSKVVTVC